MKYPTARSKAVRRPAAGLIGLLLTVSLAAANPPLPVFVSILPQQTFVEAIGGEHVAVSAMVGPGHSHATYEPSPQQMVKLSQAKLYFRIGVAFENAWMDRLQALNPAIQVIDTREGVPLLDNESPQDTPHDGAHAFGPEGPKDPHIWLDPNRVKIQARTIRDALSAADPAHRTAYETNYRHFVAELETLDQEVRQILAPVKGRRFLVFHPIWGYFADAYGLEQVPIEVAGKEPSAKQLARIIAMARAQGIKAIFVQQQFSARAAQTVAGALDAEVVQVDPLAADYFNNLRAVARAFAQALQE